MKRALALVSLFLVQCASPPTLDEKRAATIDEVAAQVDRDNLMSTVEAFVKAHEDDTPLDCQKAGFPFQHPYCHLTHDLARESMRQRLEQLGLTVHVHSVSDGTYSTSNIVAEKKGTQRPNEIVMVGAHYDAFFSGADDNSTGVAAVLEIARILAKRDFPRTIRFVGFDLEEYGIVGSIRYASTEAAEDDIVGAIVFDCIGFRSDEPESQSGLPGLPTPSAGNFLAVIGNSASSRLSDDAWLVHERLGVVEVIGVEAPGISDSLASGNFNRSDHTAFWLQGKPVLFLTDTANFRNPNYHEPSDEVATLDPAFLESVTKLSAALIAYWAGG